jgi:hypothetical protein
MPLAVLKSLGARCNRLKTGWYVVTIAWDLLLASQSPASFKPGVRWHNE